MRFIFLALFLIAAGTVRAQEAAPAPTTERVDNPTELYKLKHNCLDFK